MCSEVEAAGLEAGMTSSIAFMITGNMVGECGCCPSVVVVDVENIG